MGNSDQPIPPTSATNLKNLTIDERREWVKDNVIAGFSYRHMAKVLGVSHQTIGNDMKAIHREMAKQYAGDMKRWAVIQSRRLDMLLRSDWVDATTTKALGHAAAVERVLKIIALQMRLQGLGDGSAADLLAAEEIQRGRVQYVEVEVVRPAPDVIDAEYAELLGDAPPTPPKLESGQPTNE